MGGVNSGTPPSREGLEEAFKLIRVDGLSIREAARRTGICRDTISKYLADPRFRRKVARCPECGAVVNMPCRLCSIDTKVAVLRRDKARLARARRRKPATAG